LLQQNTLSNTHQEKRDLQAKTKRSKKQKRDVLEGKDVIFFFLCTFGERQEGLRGTVTLARRAGIGGGGGVADGG
jgi:hypothetical protein